MKLYSWPRLEGNHLPPVYYFLAFPFHFWGGVGVGEGINPKRANYMYIQFL